MLGLQLMRFWGSTRALEPERRGDKGLIGPAPEFVGDGQVAGIMSEEQLLRELRILYANRPMQFTKLVTKYYKGERARQILETLKTWPSS
jgi:hypothetical protein